MVPENIVWHLIHGYFRKHGLVRHQIENFDAFLHVLLPTIIQEMYPIRVNQDEEEHCIALYNLSVKPPMMTGADGVERPLLPHMARMHNLTYASDCTVDVVHDIHRDGVHVERRLFRETVLCSLPIMVGSQACHLRKIPSRFECKLDPGGYFIVNGNEKVVVAQEKLRHNVPYVFQIKQPARFAYVCEVRACHERKLRSTSSMYCYITHAKKGCFPEMVVSLPFLSIQLPIYTVFRLLGVTSRDEAVEMVAPAEEGGERRIVVTMMENDPMGEMSYEDLLEHIGREGTRDAKKERREKYLQHLVNCEVLPCMD